MRTVMSTRLDLPGRAMHRQHHQTSSWLEIQLSHVLTEFTAASVQRPLPKALVLTKAGNQSRTFIAGSNRLS